MSEREQREFDAWIAEHVMGDKPEPSKSVPFSSEQYCHPHYTTDPAAAMLVLEKCRCVDSVHIMPPSPDHNCEIWGCASRAQADTLPLAICKFAQILFSK